MSEEPETFALAVQRLKQSLMDLCSAIVDPPLIFICLVSIRVINSVGESINKDQWQTVESLELSLAWLMISIFLLNFWLGIYTLAE